jgi:hypothetical protein
VGTIIVDAVTTTVDVRGSTRDGLADYVDGPEPWSTDWPHTVTMFPPTGPRISTVFDDLGVYGVV